MTKSMIESVIRDFHEDIANNKDPIRALKEALVTYAISAQMDSSVRQEVDQLCQELFGCDD